MASTIRIFISAGEASGDLYGSFLIQALRSRFSEAEFFGCGGKKMRAAGCETLVDAHQISMVGLVEVVPGLPRAWKAFRRVVRTLQERQPALAVLIDFPDFNLRLAKRLKRAGVEVVYFVAPQVWAWRRGRLGALRRHVNRLLCIFPFEEQFFCEAGVRAEFVGHPLIGRVAPSMSASEFRRSLGIDENLPLIALLPGSRRREISLNLPPMLETARRLAQEGEYRFLLPAASAEAAESIRSHIAGSGERFFVVEHHTYDAVAHASVAVVASGTATIETALLETPMVVVYRVTPASWWLGRRLVRVPFFSMVNLVAGRQIVREFIQSQFQPEAVAREARKLLDGEAAREMRRELREVAERLRPRAAPVGAGVMAQPAPDAIERAVTAIESLLRARLSPVSEPAVK